MPTLKVIQGDITRSVKVDAIVTLINPGGMWFGGLDGAIQRTAGNHYHGQAARVGRLVDRQVVLARGSAQRHSRTFNDVIFVVDALKTPLNELVFIALDAAEKAGYQKVALPLMRTGVMLGVVEKTVEEAALQMREGIARFESQFPNSPMEITVVVYGDPSAVRMLEASSPSSIQLNP